MSDSHPTDRKLAALVDGLLSDVDASRLRPHVEKCARCKFRIGAAHERVWSGQSTSDESVVVRIIEESAGVPMHGELWRLTWDDTSQLAVIWAVNDDRCTVIPVVDSVDADEWTAILNPTKTGGVGTVGVAVALETTVPWAVLDARLTHIEEMELVSSLRAAYRKGEPTSTERGAAVHSPLDDRLPALAEVAETLHTLANATPWQTQIIATAAVAYTFDELEPLIGSADALALIQGADPTPDQADLIEAATGTRPVPKPVDVDLRRTIDHPARKAAIRALARRNGRSEADERRLLASEAAPELTAARGTYGAPPDYSAIVDRLLDA